MSGLSKTALALVIVGALNWLLVGLFNFDLVATLFGQGSALARIVYVLVGLAGIYCISLLFVRPAVSRPIDVRRAA